MDVLNERRRHRSTHCKAQECQVLVLVASCCCCVSSSMYDGYQMLSTRTCATSVSHSLDECMQCFEDVQSVVLCAVLNTAGIAASKSLSSSVPFALCICSLWQHCGRAGAVAVHNCCALLKMLQSSSYYDVPFAPRVRHAFGIIVQSNCQMVLRKFVCFIAMANMSTFAQSQTTHSSGAYVFKALLSASVQ